MIRRILVPLDGSAFGEHALPRAIALARRYDAAIELAHVHEVVSLVYLEGLPQIDTSLELDGIQSDRGYLDRALERVAATGVRASATLLDGPTVAALESHVAAGGIDLVVMTTHGRGPLSRAWLGSVADGLARHTSRPVLLIRPPSGTDSVDAARPDLASVPAPFQRVLVPLDTTSESESVLEHALGVADENAALVLLHVVPPTLVVGGQLFPLGEERREDLTGMARETLAPTVAMLEARRKEVRLEIVVARDVAGAVLDTAARHGADLIALSTHGRGEIARLVFGSVTDKVLRAATLPVLLRRPPKTRAGR